LRGAGKNKGSGRINRGGGSTNGEGKAGRKRRQMWMRQKCREVRGRRREAVRRRGTRLGLGRVAPFRGLRVVGRKGSFRRGVL
jgi:hypothetical protein